MELNREELRALIACFPTPVRASEFLLEYNRKRERLQEQMQKLQNRAAHLDYLIHSSIGRRDVADRSTMWRRWKRRILAALNRKRTIYTQGEIAELLCVSKSTISRRIERVIDELKRRPLWNA